MVKSPEKTSKKFMEIEKRYKKQPAMMRSCDKIGINQNLADLLPRMDDRRRLIGQHPVSSVSSLTWLYKFLDIQFVLFNGKLVTITSIATTRGFMCLMCITILYHPVTLAASTSLCSDRNAKWTKMWHIICCAMEYCIPRWFHCNAEINLIITE